MRKTTFTFLAAAATVAFTSQAADTGRYEALREGVGISISPNGRYIVGYEVGSPYTSFLLDRESGDYDWFSYYTKGSDEYFSSGRVRGVNDNGTAVGDKYDEDFICPETDPEWDSGSTYYNVPLHTAFVYQNGEIIMLDHASADCSEDNWAEHHENPEYYLTRNDGSYALAINNEETLILGYLTYAGYLYPCYWEWDAAAGAWGAGKMMPAGPFDYYGSKASSDLYYRYDCTSDATRALFRPYRMAEPYQLFTVGQPTTQYSIPDVYDMGDAAISPNGRYTAYAVVSGNVDSEWGIGLYDNETGESKLLALPSNIDMQFVVTCVSNDKKIYFYVKERPSKWLFWVCDMEQESFASIDDYMTSFGVEFENAPSTSLLYSIPIRISDDGRTLLCSVNNGTQIVSSYIIELPDSQPIMPVAPEEVDLFYTSTETASVVWKQVESTQPISYYQVSIDGVAVNIEPNADENGKLRYDFDLDADGHPHSVLVSSVIVSNGTAFKSTDAERTIQMSPRTDVYFFDDLDSNAMYTSDGQAIYAGDDWVVYTSSNFYRTFECSTTSGTNYSLVFDGLSYGAGFGENDIFLTSRFLDAYAYDAKDMLLTFSYSKGGSLSEMNPDADCYFAVEYATDGENWVEIFNRNALDMQFNMYHYEVIDLSFLADEMFQIRFRAHNSWGTSFDMMLDYIGIIDGNQLANAPTGLRATSVSDKKVSLAWKNSTDEYEVGYTDWRWSASWYSSVGTDQPSMIAAIDLTPTQLAPYVGMYLNSVTTNIYDGNEKQTQAQAKVYESIDGAMQEIATGDIDPKYFAQNADGQIFNYPSYGRFDEPVLIEADKTYRVGVRIYNYEDGTYPLYYSTASEDDYVWGRTDLFSEDEGKTWDSLGEYWYNFEAVEGETEEEDYRPYESISYVTWPIRVGIIDDLATEPKEQDLCLYAFDVLRNGEKVNTERMVSFTEQKFTDSNPVADGAEYQVRAYYRDGRISELSEPLKVTSTGISNVSADKEACRVSVANGIVRIQGDFSKAALYNVAGQQLLSTSQDQFSVSGMPSGVYVLRVDNRAYKIAIN